MDDNICYMLLVLATTCALIAVWTRFENKWLRNRRKELEKDKEELKKAIARYNRLLID